jgi:hypothetical protein
MTTHREGLLLYTYNDESDESEEAEMRFTDIYEHEVRRGRRSLYKCFSDASRQANHMNGLGANKHILLQEHHARIKALTERFEGAQ